MRKLSNIIEKIDSEEYKKQRIEKNRKYIEELTLDCQLGYYIGEYIVNRFLPTLSIDSFKTRNLIQISEEDFLKLNQLKESFNSTYVNSDNYDKEAWNLCEKYRQYLIKKYIPGILDCHLPYIKINDVEEFKKGLSSSLWNSDVCYYNTDNIQIINNIDDNSTVIKLSLDV